jgi:hypothetical protein
MQQASLPQYRPAPTLLPGDSRGASLERIWRMRPSVIEVSIGTSNDPYSADPTDWVKTAMTRTQAALALRTARAENLLIEQSRTGYVISGGFRL